MSHLKKKTKTYCFILTFGAGNDPRGKDMSASQDGVATLSADHHLWADLLHMSEKITKASAILFLNLKFSIHIQVQCSSYTWVHWQEEEAHREFASE